MPKRNRNSRPKIPKGSHPVEMGHYTLPTPMVMAAAAVVIRWVSQCSTGSIIRADPRIGKSRLRKYLMQLLPRHFPNILAYSMSCRTALAPSEKAFFERILTATKYLLPMQGTAADMRNSLTAFIVKQAEQSGQRRVVLFIDESQKILEAQYGWLIDLHNELNDAEIDFTVVLIGQNELLDIRSKYISRRKNQIVGRFMLEEYELRGIRSQADMGRCLACYDNPALTQYPKDSGWCFTRYFFNRAYDGGWRLRDLTATLWEAFDEVRIANGVPGSRLEIPMQAFSWTVNSIMQEFGTRNELAPSIPCEELASIIVSAGFGIPTSTDDEDTDDENEDEK